MLGSSFRRKVVLLLLCSVLVAPWASAADSTARHSLDLFSRALSFLKSVWGAGEVPPPPDPPRPSGLIPASDASGVLPPQDPPRPGSTQLDDGEPPIGNGGSGKP